MRETERFTEKETQIKRMLHTGADDPLQDSECEDIFGVEAASLEEKGDVCDAGVVFFADLVAAVKHGGRRLTPRGFSNWQNKNNK